MKKYYKSIILFFAIVTAIAVWIYFVIKDASKTSELVFAEYPLLQKKEKVSGKLSNLYLSSGFRANAYLRFITLDNGLKLSISVESCKDCETLGDKIAIGTRIEKKTNEDSIYIINNTDQDSSFFKFKLEPLK